MYYAMFIDFENIERTVEKEIEVINGVDEALKIIRNLIEFLEKDQHRIILRRAFADWESLGSNAQASLALMSIKTEYVMGKRGKNSADLALSLNALEVLLTRTDIQAFIIVGGDRDYIPIVSRLLESGKQVWIVSFPNATSGDLITIVGQKNFIDATTLLPPSIPRRPEGKRRIEVPQEEVVKKTRGDKDETPPHLSQGNLVKCISLIQDAEEQHGREIWLTPFFRNFMNEAFNTLNDDQRKEILSEMESQGIVEIKSIQGNWGNRYSALFLNHDHSLVREVLGKLPVDTEGEKATQAPSMVVSERAK